MKPSKTEQNNIDRSKFLKVSRESSISCHIYTVLYHFICIQFRLLACFFDRCVHPSHVERPPLIPVSSHLISSRLI